MIEVEVGDTIVEFPDGTPPDVMKTALQKQFASKEVPASFDERFPEQEQSASIPGVRGLVEPFLSYPETQGQMARESAQQMGEGASRIGRALTPRSGPRVGPFPDEQAANLVTGAGELAAGGLGYIASPINAALRTVVGKPVEDITGVPKEYTEFGASLALPIPKRIPLPARAEPKAAPKVSPTQEQLFESADANYAAARKSPYRMAPEDTKAMVDDIRTSLKEEGYRDYLVPKTFKALDEFSVTDPSGVADIDGVRKALNRAGADPAEKDAVRRAISAIDAKLSPAVPEIAAARGDYAAGSRSELITEAVERAQRQASAANSGQNFDNALRQQFKAIRNNPKKIRGLSADELAMMDEVIGGGKAGNTTRFLGNLMGGGGGLGSVVTATAGGLATGGWGAVAPVFGMAFKKMGNQLTQGQIEKLDELVRARSPLGQAVGSSVKAWSEAAQAFEIEPSVKNFVRMSIASRNLSNTAKGAQVSLTPDSLLRSATGSMKAAAEDEQVDPERVVRD